MSLPCLIVESPVGPLTLVARGDRLAAVLWPQDAPGRVCLDTLQAMPAHAVLQRAQRQLDEYFAGRRYRFDLPLAFTGTDFQRAVWQALLSIPYGQTRSYAQIAEQIGRPTAIRAVGAANGRNPISIIAPCHRVIGSGGALTGFAGGLATKHHLLALEARMTTVSATPIPAGWDQPPQQASLF